MKRLELLDYGRFFATGCVLAFHYFFNGIQNGKISSLTHSQAIVAFAKYGYLGVEFFFMISGYVIFFSARNRSASQFAVSRAVRLYPAFWVAVVVTSIVAQFWGGSLMSVDWPQALANLTMAPGLFGHAYVDGVYWTLQYELNFYLLVLFCLLVGLQSKLETLFLLWPAAMVLALLAGVQYLPFMGRYYCFFAAGAILAIQREHLSKRSLASLLAAFLLCVVYSAGKAPGLSVSQEIAYSPVVIGLIVAAQFAFFFFLNSAVGSAMRIPGSRLAGGLTYPIYLVHAHLGYMLLSHVATDANKAVVYPIVIALVLVLAYSIHMLVERRYAAAWHSLFAATVGAFVDGLDRRMHRFARVGSSWR